MKQAKKICHDDLITHTLGETLLSLDPNDKTALHYLIKTARKGYKKSLDTLLSLSSKNKFNQASYGEIHFKVNCHFLSKLEGVCSAADHEKYYSELRPYLSKKPIVPEALRLIAHYIGEDIIVPQDVITGAWILSEVATQGESVAQQWNWKWIGSFLVVGSVATACYYHRHLTGGLFQAIVSDTPEESSCTTISSHSFVTPGRATIGSVEILEGEGCG